MEIEVKIILPDDFADLDTATLSSDVLKQVVAEGYREDRMTLSQVRSLLGFDSRLETEDFLHRYNAMVYSIDDLENDLKNARDLGLE
jgi:hypothetical protein